MTNFQQKTVVTTSWDDGHPMDKKLCSLLKTYDIKGTIYYPLEYPEYDILNYDEIKELSNFFEIGSHTYSHKILPQLSEEEIMIELLTSKEKLEEIVSNEIISFCYPDGKYNQKVIDCVKKSGYVGARTTSLFRTHIMDPYLMGTTLQAVDRILLSKGKQLITSDDRGLGNHLLSSGNIFKNWASLAISSFDYVLKNGGIWHLWGHSKEIEDNDDWEQLDLVLNYVSKHGKANNVEFLTNGEILTQLF
jgi:peptidoglycan/xylan/chitin deacetylase (PgdA/CDA1 family)